MLNRIVLGTANFMQPYGILSEGAVMPREQVISILEKAIANEITVLDTALGYGDLLTLTPTDMLKEFQIITKISVLDKPQAILKKLKNYVKDQIVYGILVHDPQNLPQANIDDFTTLFESLRQEYNVSKIGVSVYDLNDVENFKKICAPDIIQIPLNPLNQLFNQPSFKAYVQESSIEVHARSLFLQGVLLADYLPERLAPLRSAWTNIQNALKAYPFPLQGLMNWAFNQDWVKSWVFGVSCLKDLNDIIKASHSIGLDQAPEFQSITHPLADPRNWNKL